MKRCLPRLTAPPSFALISPVSGVTVRMGKTLDGFSEHMKDYDDANTFVLADAPEISKDELVQVLKESGTEILLNYLPVGSEQATRFYAECALEAGVAFINNIPVFIASDPQWTDRFKDKNLPLIGDDVKSQLRATITHRALTDLFQKRGVKLALLRKEGGVLHAPSSYFCKHPPRQCTDDQACQRTE